jgi:hypothetical protein
MVKKIESSRRLWFDYEHDASAFGESPLIFFFCEQICFIFDPCSCRERSLRRIVTAARCCHSIKWNDCHLATKQTIFLTSLGLLASLTNHDSGTIISYSFTSTPLGLFYPIEIWIYSSADMCWLWSGMNISDLHAWLHSGQGIRLASVWKRRSWDLRGQSRDPSRNGQFRAAQ